MKKQLDSAGFIRLDEKDDWSLQARQPVITSFATARRLWPFVPGNTDTTKAGVRMVAHHS